jgi:NhaP-type Na+/H+ or K+/H+ antiporter
MGHTVSVTALSVIAACILGWGLVAARVERWHVTAPMAFVILGLALTHGPVGFVHLSLHSSTIRTLAEIALALVLFSDASRVNVRALAADAIIPARLLCIGLPLTIGVGALLAWVLFPSGGLWLAAALAAIVAPTDAALGTAIMSDERVPARVRRVLNVESGLNDGIVTPFVNLFLAGALAAESLSAGGIGRAAIELLGGAGIGAGVGLFGGLLLVWTTRAGWSGPGFRPLAVLALAVLAYGLALVSHTNGFVAAFVGGLAFGSISATAADQLEFTEEVGTLLTLVVWFAFGAVMLVPGIDDAGWRDVLFAVLALTAVRMAPVALSLLGSGLDRVTVSFIGWFGPRGLASVVFGLIATDSLAPADAKVVLGAVVITVALSVVAHGASAAPLARRYGSYAKDLHPGQPEHADAPPLSLRSLKIEGRASRMATPQRSTSA